MVGSVKYLSALGIVLMLAACGGGDVNDIASSNGANGAGGSSTQLRPTVYTSEGRVFNSCSLSPACSGNPYAPFFAGANAAPANGATVSGIVRIEINGNEIANAELLPASGYMPRFGIFNITGDKTRAWLDLDTSSLPNGPFNVRASAFNVPAGQPGALEIVAMSARTWNINNPVPPSGMFSATLTSAPADGGTISGITRLELRGSGIANAELLPASGYAPTYGTFNVSADRTMAWLDFDSRSLPDGVKDFRISAYNVTQGQPGASEIVVMPARRWNIQNGSVQPSDVPFTAMVTMAPPHGSIISGRIRLEVRGSGLQNVELLPASSYTPRLGVFEISFDRKFAWLEVETSTLPAGVLNARISAFNVAAGQPGASEIIAMPARQWDVRY
ncbi:hypothetical protein ASE07_21120 [Noviherbaspirillum sp. Root189]|nr:hypothetical protein ASE07_21120 [Noviherbaspirillum sp. Root189]